MPRASFEGIAEIAAELAVSVNRLREPFVGGLQRIPAPIFHSGSVALSKTQNWLRHPFGTSAVDQSQEYTDNVWAADMGTLLLHLANPDFRARSLAVDNWRALDETTSQGRGAVMAGLHIGPHLAIPLILAQLGHTVSVLASSDILKSKPEFSRAFLPDAVSRITWLSIDDPLVLLQARGVLREGGLVLGFIDLATKVSKRTAEVDFLGRRMRASYALPYLAAIANTPIMSVSLTSESGPRFTLRLGQALRSPDRDEQAIQRTLQLLFRDAERQVLDHRDQWLGWRQWQSEADRHPHPAPTIGNIVPAH